MSYNSLIDYFERYVQFSEEELREFTSFLRPCSYQRGEIILRVGETERHLRFVDVGVCREFVFKNDDSFTTNICLGHDFCSSYASFVSQMPSRVGIEAITEVSGWEMRFEDLEHLYGKSKEGERMGRLAAEHSYIAAESKMINLVTKTALERYQELLDTDPKLLQKVPQKYIAEFLGMTPESLSRLKRSVI
ncbi:MAG: Crp/Fnr family transcriptional regulator [Flavobacteriales bacterium]|nr:Crp/Fnr family transcriptional regulator [Bacteroidota bacterium]MCB9241519.1 Crp/Fnr family transcriptional regulator [Flavobacteriales bacterium]